MSKVKYASLTNAIREEVAFKVAARRHEAEEKQLTARGHELAERVYQEIYKEEHRTLMQALPEEFLPRTHGLQVKAEHRYMTLPLANYRTIAFKHFNSYNATASNCVAAYQESSVMGKELLAYDKQRRELEDAKRKDCRDLEDIFKGFKSIPALLEAWPDLESFFKPHKLEAPKQLPALQTQQLNKRFNLPPEEKEKVGEP